MNGTLGTDVYDDDHAELSEAHVHTRLRLVERVEDVA